MTFTRTSPSEACVRLAREVQDGPERCRVARSQSEGFDEQQEPLNVGSARCAYESAGHCDRKCDLHELAPYEWCGAT